MIPESYEELINKLDGRTNDGKVNWKSTSHEYTFIVDFTKFSLSIRLASTFDNREHVFFEILNSEGQIIDYFDVDEREKGWHFAYELFNKARRKARQIDLVIGDITQELDSEGLVGEEGISSESED